MAIQRHIAKDRVGSDSSDPHGSYLFTAELVDDEVVEVRKDDDLFSRLVIQADGTLKTGTGSSAPVTTFPTVVNPMSFGAVGDGVANDTAALQTALNAAGAAKAGAALPQRRFKVSSTITIPSNTLVEGVPARIIPFSGDYNVGSQLVWAGATNDVVLSTFNATWPTLRGLSVHGGNISGVTGLLIDSDNNPPSEGVRVEDFFIALCGLNDTNGVGIQIGTSVANAFQMDKTTIRRGSIRHCGTAIRLESANGFYGGILEQIEIGEHIYGIHAKTMGNCTFRNVVFGGHGPQLIADIYLDELTSNIVIEGCQTEDGDTGSQWFLLVPSTALPSQGYPITMIGNRINHVGVWINQTRRLVMIGNTFTDCNVVLGPTGYTTVVDIENRFVGTNIRTVADAVINATTTLTSATGAFVQATDVGKRVSGAGIAPGTTIASVTNSTTIELDTAATASASGVAVTFDYGFVQKSGQVLSLNPSLTATAPMWNVSSFEDDEVLRLSNIDPGAARNLGLGLNNAGPGGQRWVLESGGTSGRNPGGFDIYDPVAATAPFQIEPGCTNDVLRIRGATNRVLIRSALEVDGALDHDGTTIGLNGSAPVSKSTGWGAPTGTATKTTFDTATVTTAQLAERVKALLDYITSRGDIGA